MRSVCLFVLLAGLALAEAIDGQWKNSVDGPHGQTIDEVLDLKTNGAKLTGTFARGKIYKDPIEDGSVQGGKVRFYVTTDGLNGVKGRWKFEGTQKSGELDLELSVPNGPTFTRMFKRAK